MNVILRWLRPLIVFNIRYAGSILLFTISLAIVSAYFALKLKIDTDIANLLPENYESVKALERLQATVGGEIDLQVAIISPSFEANRAFAYALLEESKKAVYSKNKEPFFERVEFKKETEVLRDNALFLATHKELDAIHDFLSKKIEEIKLEVNPFYFDLGLEEEEDSSDQQVNIEQFEASYEAIIPSEYPVSADSTVMVLSFYPTGSKSDVQFLREMFATTEDLIRKMDPSSFHPQMQVSSGGRLSRHLMELDSITNDVFNSFASGITSVLLVVMFYFFIKKLVNYRRGSIEEQKVGILGHVLRSPVPIIIIGLPLVISLSYTFGLAYLFLGTLNTMTSVLFVILFGMGIDYGIHFYARYLEIRSSGESVHQAIMSTYDSSGSAIMTSSITTAVSLFILVIADFRGFSEFGLISGTGIVLAYFSMIFILPTLIILFERWGLILVNENVVEVKSAIPRRYPLSRAIVSTGLVLSLVVIVFLPKLEFEYDFGQLEPEFSEYVEFRQITGQVFKNQRRNPAYIIADSDQEVENILTTLDTKVTADSLSPTIEIVEALQERFPVTDSAITSKLTKIAGIRELLEDPFLKESDDTYLEKLRRASKTVEALKIDQVPDYLKSRFVTKDGEIGRFVIVYPLKTLNLSDGRNSIAFKQDVGEITTADGKKFHAASTSIVAADMLDLMIKESPYMVIATTIVIIMLMYLAFHSVRWTLIALLPLVMGLLFTFGIMLLFGVKLNFYNIIVLPAILGIGEDCGVHIASRYLEEGKSSMRKVLSSTGQHITIGSLTTILGFAGLLFTAHPGLYSIGFMATVGIFMTWLTSVTFMPALVQWLEDKQKIEFN